MVDSRVVIVGTDGSEHGDEALRFAAGEALLRDCDLVVVLARRSSGTPEIDDLETPAPVSGNVNEAAAQAALCRALGLSPDALPAYRVVCGDVELSALLVHNGADLELIVMSQHHGRLLDRVFHRPRADGLAGRAQVPVAIVPERPLVSEDRT